MKTIIFAVFYFLFSYSVVALTSHIISGTVLDSQTKKPISDVAVFIENQSKGILSDKDGKFSIPVENVFVVVMFSKTGYEKLRMNAKDIDSVHTRIYLKRRDIQLPEVTINNKAVSLTRNETVNVLDYSFMGDSILLITFKNNLSKAILVLINQYGDTISTAALPERPEKLFKDCLGNNHVVTEKHAYQIYFQQQLKLFPPITIEQFNTALVPCVAQTKENLFFKKIIGPDIIIPSESPLGFDTKKNKHIISYYSINKSTKTKKELTLIVDRKTLKKNAEEEEHLNLVYHDLEHGCKSCARVQDERYILKEIYAPLFNIHDTLLIFNYPDSTIEYFSTEGKKLNKRTPINYHRRSMEWKWMTLLDDEQNDIYTVFQHDDFYELKQVDLNTGQLISLFRLPLLPLENIKIRNGAIYYLYEGKNEMDTKVLYKQQLNTVLTKY